MVIHKVWPVTIFIFGIVISGCASDISIPDAPHHLAAQPASPEADEIKDPYEEQNRTTLKKNMEFNQKVIYPLAESYKNTFPEPVRNAIGNFSQNLGEPAIFANLILQLRIEAALKTASRFTLNSTLGVGGLFDFAETQNISRQTGDFGQTLYVWGFRESDYLILPVFGPTNVRDAIGNGIEFAVIWPTVEMLPTKLASAVNNVNNLGTVLHPFSNMTRVEELQELEKSSIDFYAMLRSVVDQKRKSELDEALETSAFTASPQSYNPKNYKVPMNLYEMDKFYDPPQLITTVDVLRKADQAKNSKTEPSRVIIGEVEEGS